VQGVFDKKLIQTTSTDFLAVLNHPEAGVSTNVFLRILHNRALDLGWIVQPVISILALHYDDIPQEEVEDREVYRVTRPIRAILDVSHPQEVSDEILSQAFSEAKSRGLITGTDIERFRKKLPRFLVGGKRLRAA
jgi:hypothetical protein